MGNKILVRAFNNSLENGAFLFRITFVTFLESDTSTKPDMEQTIVDAINHTFGHIEEEKFAAEGAEKIAKGFIKEYKFRNNQNLYQPPISQSDENGFDFGFPVLPKPVE